MKKIYFWGAGSAVKDICLIINKINDIKPTWEIMGFIDKDPVLSGQKFLGFPIISVDELPYGNNFYGICAPRRGIHGCLRYFDCTINR